MKQSLFPLLALSLFACSQQTETKSSQGDWIKGTEQEKVKTIEKHFRGFDNAMVETGYRYQELYWAGQDQNWEYGIYQLEKLKLALEYGLQRRPNRAKSAGHFLANVLPGMQKAVQSKDTAVFNSAFQVLTANCNSCHGIEKVPFFSVKIPTSRQSSISK